MFQTSVFSWRKLGITIKIYIQSSLSLLFARISKKNVAAQKIWKVFLEGPERKPKKNVNNSNIKGLIIVICIIVVLDDK